MNISMIQKYMPICERMIDRAIKYVQTDKELEAMKKHVDRQKKKETQKQKDEGKEKLDELGRKTWKKIHATVDNLPDDSNLEKVKKATEKIHDMINEYPCRECRTHGLEAEKAVKLGDSQTKKDAVIRTCEIHNSANEITGKEKIDCKQYYDKL